jgi:23S rRNA (cytosine1962-C5)-methyltransferase
LSTTSQNLPELRLRRGEERRLRAGHLWVFSNEVDTTATPLTAFEPGQQARVVTDRGQPLGIAYVNPATLIAARLLTRDAETPVGRAWVLTRLRAALALRESLYPNPYYRLVFGESDGLPGLVIDRYGDVLVGQIGTAGMERLRPIIEAALAKVIAPRVLLWKNDSGARSIENLPSEIVCVQGDRPTELEVLETLPDGRELRFAIPFESAQKTGWFYDQTFNRSVLDVCSYAGGWATTAAALGARAITCIDSSASALARAGAHVQAAVAGQGAAPVVPTLLRDDAFDALAALAAAGERFDAVIVDPPAFIKRRKEFPQGQAAYRKLNQLALRVLEPEGLLVSCSCSFHMPGEELRGAIQSAARHVDRFVQVLHQGGQSPDHPVHPAIPETRYLKAFFCRVSRAL